MGRLLQAAVRRLSALAADLLAPGDGVAPRGAGTRRTSRDGRPEAGGLGGLGGDGGGAASC
ncbi:hypothetical protein FHN55_15645 [Streptomyces sp. NP160]|uniref:hypothetical protein n=1 Tax=Streptomyces sp. NP160 TaxID=2586637 RepID=UPI00111BAB7C|nr:hypothetical protein [Streptomyces sp. NP160]TNM63260.1 hypothetical protein FHN55_15645 [Streptomyces sp. NP160]